MSHSVYPFEEAASLGQGIIWNCHCGLLGGARSSGWPFPLSCLKGPWRVRGTGIRDGGHPHCLSMVTWRSYFTGKRQRGWEGEGGIAVETNREGRLSMRRRWRCLLAAPEEVVGETIRKHLVAFWGIKARNFRGLKLSKTTINRLKWGFLLMSCWDNT